MNRFLLVVLLSHILAVSGMAQAPAYVPHTVVIKLNETAIAAKGVEVLTGQELATFSGIKQIQAVSSFAKKQQAKGASSLLDGLYKISLNNEVEEQVFLSLLAKYDNVIYAERYPNVYPLEIPNDPQAKTNGPQFYLAQIKAYDAWSSTRGNKDLIIGILDTGIDLDHEDLLPNLYVNEAELIDGIDNDNDGYIDNITGWDIADNDNMPEADSDEHGTVVAGVAAAATNNAIGIAGVGYNTKLMPVKVFKTDNNFTSNSYEGIIYAADQGCDIINLSWGSASPYSQYAQDIINYAALERDVVIVAAAGNTNDLLDFYPASYDNVLSVGFVDGNDRKSINSTYSYFIDMVAPGENIYSTKNGNTYGTDGGSSLAAPMVAGAAALVKAFKPTLSAVEIMELLRINTDDISNIGTNSDYTNQLGTGRLNIFKALNNDQKPSVRITEFSFSNGFENAAYYGDTLTIDLAFKNYLSAVEGLTISLAVDNPYVSVLESEVNVGSMQTGEVSSNNGSPLRIALADDIPEETTLYLRFNMKGDFYEDYQVLKLVVNKKNRTFDFANWKFALSASGNIGLNNENPYGLQQLSYGGNSLIKHFGIVLAASADSISKNILIAPLVNNYEQDFETVEELKRFDDITADLDIRSEFKELSNLDTVLGLFVRQRLLGWNEPGHENYLVLSYEVLNKGQINYDSLYFNLFSDWYIGDYDANQLSFDAASNMAYATDAAKGLYVGIAGLELPDSVFYALDLAANNGHTKDLTNDTLSNQQIWDFNKKAFSKSAAGELAGGNDVASLQGYLLKNFQIGQAIKHRFVIATASNLAELRTAVDAAKEKLEASETALPFGAQILLCEGESPIFKLENEDSIRVFASALIDTVLFAGDSLYLDPILKDSTLYYEVIDSLGFASYRKRLELNVIKPTANFKVNVEPYLLTPGVINTFLFEDLSSAASKRRWIFSNGYESTQASPEIPFTEAGNVNIQLIAENEIGCVDTINTSITLAWRAPTPNIDNMNACKGATVILSDPAIGAFTVYGDSLGAKQLFQGESFAIADFQKDTLFYVRNENGQYPSIFKPVKVSVLEAKADFKLFTDINSNDIELQALAVSQSSSTDIQWLVNGVVVGTTDSIYVSLRDFPETALQLVASNDFGCNDTLSYQPIPSETPVFEPYFLCDDQSIKIKATNTNSLYFYADETLSQFLGKGSFLNLVGVNQNTTVYAVNVADIIPSEVVKVPIRVSVLNADFNTDRDTLNLAYDQRLTVSALSNEAYSYTWYVGDGRELNGKEVSFTYSAPGIYDVILSVGDSLNCVESQSQKIVVFDDPILGSRQELKAFFKVFPNPANQVIHLEGIDNFQFDQYEIVDVKGKIILSSNNDKPSRRAEVINVKQLSEGIYYLVIKKDKARASFLFMVKR